MLVCTPCSVVNMYWKQMNTYFSQPARKLFISGPNPVGVFYLIFLETDLYDTCVNRYMYIV